MKDNRKYWPLFWRRWNGLLNPWSGFPPLLHPFTTSSTWPGAGSWLDYCTIIQLYWSLDAITGRIRVCFCSHFDSKCLKIKNISTYIWDLMLIRISLSLVGFISGSSPKIYVKPANINSKIYNLMKSSQCILIPSDASCAFFFFSFFFLSIFHLCVCPQGHVWPVNINYLQRGSCVFTLSHHFSLLRLPTVGNYSLDLNQRNISGTTPANLFLNKEAM